MPSGTETLGPVVLEAMASGTPVVATREGGLVDIVRDGVTGHLYPYGDAAAAVAEVQKLLFDPGRSASAAWHGAGQSSPFRRFEVSSPQM